MRVLRVVTAILVCPSDTVSSGPTPAGTAGFPDHRIYNGLGILQSFLMFIDRPTRVLMVSETHV